MKYLILSSIFEIIWVNLLKSIAQSTHQYTVSAIVIATMILSLYFLSEAVKTLPLTFAYAVWTSSGLVGTALIQHVYWNHHLSMQSWCAMLLIVSGLFLFNQTEVN